MTNTQKSVSNQKDSKKSLLNPECPILDDKSSIADKLIGKSVLDDKTSIADKLISESGKPALLSEKETESTIPDFPDVDNEDMEELIPEESLPDGMKKHRKAFPSIDERIENCIKTINMMTSFKEKKIANIQELNDKIEKMNENIKSIDARTANEKEKLGKLVGIKNNPFLRATVVNKNKYIQLMIKLQERGKTIDDMLAMIED